MDPKYYCDTVQSELTGLKARAYDIVRQLEKMPNKDQLAPQFQEVFALVDDMTISIDHLRTECPTEFSSQKNDIEQKKTKLRAKIDIWDKDHIAGGYVGG